LKETDNLGNRLYTYRQVAQKCRCGYSTVKRIKKEAEEEGLLETEEDRRTALGMVEADFDAECERARGSSFLKWLNTRFKDSSDAKSVFNFCSLVWERLWDKCSMVDFKTEASNLGEQCAMTFVEEFKADQKRFRYRLKHIRYIFRFMNRRDLCDAHLRMPESRAPRSKRDVPEITFLDFPEKLEKCIELMVRRYGPEAQTLLRFKIESQMRTGDEADQRELWGITVDDPEMKSWIMFGEQGELRSKITAKRSEEWSLIWLSPEVKEAVMELYEQRETGQSLFSLPRDDFRRAWTKVTKKVIGRSLKLHDLRKVSLTWLYVMGVPLEVASMLNVGWKDIGTALKHYLDIKPILRRSYREQYREMIPEWFKGGLDDFIGLEAMLPGQSGATITQAQTGTQHY
jgi:integrase